MRTIAVRLAIAGALLFSVAPRASAAPVLIGTFSWEDVDLGLGPSPNFTVTDDSGNLQPYNFLDLFVTLTLTTMSADGVHDTVPLPLFSSTNPLTTSIYYNDQTTSASGATDLASDEILFASLGFTLRDPNHPDLTLKPIVSDLAPPPLGTSWTSTDIRVNIEDSSVPVPEPASWMLVLAGLAALRTCRKRRALR